MKRFLLIFLTTILLSNLIHAQRALYIGLEVGPKGDFYQFDDPAGLLSTRPAFYAPNIEIKLDYRMTPRYSLSTGIIFNNYGESFRLKDQFNLLSGSSNAMATLDIPFRGHIRLFPWKAEEAKIRIGATGGYHVVFNLDYQSFSSSETGSFGFNQEVILQASTRNENTNLFNLVEGGLFLDVELRPKWILTFSSSYVHGFEDVLESDIAYSTDGGLTFEQATAVSRGSYYFFHAGVKFRISREGW